MTLFAIFAAIPPAAIPLSMFTTDNPNEQLCNIDAKAAIPFSPYPYPTDVGIPIISFDHFDRVTSAPILVFYYAAHLIC